MNGLRNLGTYQRTKRPMLLPLGTLVDPAAKQLNFRGSQTQIGMRRGHLFAGIIAGDSPHQFAGRRVAGSDHQITAPVLRGLPDRLRNIEPQLGFTAGRIGTMAQRATIGEQRQYLTGEIDRLFSLKLARGATDTQQDKAQQNKIQPASQACWTVPNGTESLRNKSLRNG